MSEHGVFETPHWRVSHRRDARYPGYLMVSSCESVSELYELSADALAALGPVLKQTEVLLREAFSPRKVIFYKLGFSPGFSCHFHVAPITEQLLYEISGHPDYDDDPDGNDAILYLSRVYCERELTIDECADQRRAISDLRLLLTRHPAA